MALQRKVLHRNPDAPSDVTSFPPWIDTTLHAVSEIERRIDASGIAMPAGGSVLVIATRPPQGAVQAPQQRSGAVRAQQER
jgi:hypothetical protein